MPNRPSIPAEIKREILLESGHRCAVCGTPCPLERAHIIPWHKSREHKAEDLICLCANCHQRADLENWGAKQLREYKREPWVLRQHGNVDVMPGPKTAKVELTIEVELERFDERDQRWLQYGLAGFLDISPEAVQIELIQEGSVKIIVELPKQSAERLLSAYQRNDSELVKYLAPLVLLDLRREAAERERIPVTKPLDFIDRKKEIELFASMLAGNTPYRVLAFLIRPRQGKTYLMKYLLDYCRQQQIPAALVDFDTGQGGKVVSYWEFIYRVCGALRWENFPEVRACEKRHPAVLSVVQIQMTRGYAGDCFGEEDRFEEVRFGRVSSRGPEDVGHVAYYGARDQFEVRQERQMYEMGSAFQSDLARMCLQSRVVLLLDTFEHATVETRNWIDEWLFDCLPGQYSDLKIIIAGRPELHDYLSQPKAWKALMRIREAFDPPEEDDIREFARVQGIVIPDHLIPYAVKYASYKISMLADIAQAHARFPDE